MAEREGQLPVFLCPGFMLGKKKKNQHQGQEVLDTPTPTLLHSRHLLGLDGAGGRQGEKTLDLKATLL